MQLNSTADTALQLCACVPAQCHALRDLHGAFYFMQRPSTTVLLAAVDGLRAKRVSEGVERRRAAGALLAMNCMFVRMRSVTHIGQLY